MGRIKMDNKRKTQRRTADSPNIQDLIKSYEFLTQSARDIMLFLRHKDGMILDANSAAVKAYQYSLKKLKTMTVYDLRTPKAQSQVMPQMDAASSGGILFETEHVRKNGEIFPVEVSSQGTMIGDEQILLSIVRDISERKKAQQQLLESENNLRALLNAGTESFFLMDKNGNVLAANETFANRLHVTMDKLIGANVYDLFQPEVSKQRRRQAENVIHTGKPVRFEDVRNDRHIDQVIYPVFDANCKVVRLAVFGIDITHHRELEKKLETIAFTDQLTGIYNRRGFFNLATQQLQLAKRSKQKMLLFFADIDGMKWINDTFCHEEGDRALIDAARILLQTFRSVDILSRIGGDEFAILAINADEIILDNIMSRCQKFADKLNFRKSRKYKLSISIGYAIYDPDNPISLDELMAQADISMYENKKVKSLLP
jgi:PAS domain S-box/PAS domain S-box/diguanylate cyclase (GGDEF) domain